ncbi:MAG TPA: hypothetical protein VH042_01440 [Solirubrobacterales bacterium]|jgi:hypothetical protein|nr:hypothetical protein [Solirubrobacterales bacterium]
MGLLPLVATLALLLPGTALAAGEYGFKPGSVGVSESSQLAGAHPDLTVEFEMNSEESGEPVAATGEFRIAMPAGLTGNPNAVSSCSMLQLMSTDVETPGNEGSCPQDSQVGVTEVILFNQEGGAQSLIEPIFNMEPPGGGDVVARLGFYAKFFPTLINLRVRSESDYGLTASLEGVGSLIPLLSATTTIWGVPADESHDPLRITSYEALHCGGSPCTAPNEEPRHSGLVPAPFLSNPTQCGVPQRFGLTAISYLDPSLSAAQEVQLPGLTGCEKIGFSPSFSATPTSSQADSPTGLDVELGIPQDETAKGRSTSQLRDAKVVLPRGMTIAADAADGLQGCTAEQAGYKSTTTASCPAAAKIGSAEIDVPALAHPIEGAVYQRTPEPGHLFRIWLVADELGVHIALPGEIELDPRTGQVTSLFLETPRDPVRDFKLHFKSGPRAPLATPSSCGTYFTHYELSPWSGTAPASGDASMAIDAGCDTGHFEPRLSAGSIDSSAGSYSPFVTELTRRSGEQNIAGLGVALPRGVLAKAAGVVHCEGAAAEIGNCPAGSQVGTIEVASGPGSNPLWIPQVGKAPTAVYLSGPYQGSPYGLVFKVPAQAGPFDLGTVVVRAGIDVDPESAQVSVRSNPLPQFLEGVPVSYRTIEVDIDRDRFALNPTNCSQKQTEAHLTSAQGAAATATSPYRVLGCGELGFKPKLALKLGGSTRRGGNPALTATLTTRAGDANIARAQVALPRSEFLDQSHIQTICTRVQFAADACPAASVYGRAKAWTPLLDHPLAGPVYLRSSKHTLPDLVADLRGDIEVVLDGRIDSIKGEIRSTFEAVPDAPVTKFVLAMRGGKRSLLENSTDLCAATHRADAAFTGQNGKRTNLHPSLRIACKREARKQRKQIGE